jgi:DNA-binding beta-propeller fold protein YncE
MMRTSPASRAPSVSVGSGAFRFAADADWAQLPSGYHCPEVVGVATDKQNRVYTFNRGERPVLVFEPDGTFHSGWGEGLFARPHGITIGPDGNIWCSDDFDHTVKKFTPDGQLLLKLGVSGQPSDTGATSIDFRTVRHAGPPFNYPTNVAFSSEGDVYISDGYANVRVHKFAPDGRLHFSWGELGGGPGQFRLPHGIAVDHSGTVYVADRENSRIQLFTPDGRYLDSWEDVARPCQVTVDANEFVYVAELGFRAGMWPGTTAPGPEAPGGRVSIFDSQGRLVARWGGGRNPTAPGDFFAPHDICVDARGDVYVAEVVWSAGGCRGLVPADCHSLQKFVRQPVGEIG